ncbi:hypothetical protein Syn7803C97_21 [Synechococcus phage S-MbCM6]|jgi:Rps23 Pro-64 3,4-dihydroxylase Tpa1-like proline 4-hydroxylase|uniref:Prolyl 4-hydroxylase alpha subunit Fe(2+) 2OG dioxygenase domain-containing protein n=3 Tax=Namakavirus smbcm6 TaxID=2734120 RepID=V5UTH3_9CAUD|nr:hypothetical protein S-MbCM25_020 [Synechococcus phage S-MbCM25]AIX14414.1 hypothetical protein Syn7803C43_19 [Synechococcus phage ACG-2014c]AIX22574.1 hypothetical protein Syn7803C97_21 [Synechococcus phage ACG-2014c]AIX22788.1 hypothetical protein Syn7803C98_20 [Synechococcus phage ACG-2014c]AIX38020.1 hypothetical protein Syn7803US88_19 [Synechococcus phage ACG-2014c]
MIEVYDNFLDHEDHLWINNFVKESQYFYGQVDDEQDENSIPTGVTSGIDLDRRAPTLLDSAIQSKTTVSTLYRAYINMFSPGEISNFHVDDHRKNTYTGLYYANTEKWNHQEGGETQFLINNEIYGILPIPNRMVVFDSRLLHKATPFHRRHRWTIALKYAD